MLAKGGEEGRWGGLPVALAPTGSNLEQTAPNVFIRVVIGAERRWGGPALPDAE